MYNIIMNYTELESKRKKFAALVGGGIALVVIGILIMVFMGEATESALPIISWAMMIIGGASAGIASAQFNKIKNEFKTKVVPGLVREILGQDCTYSPRSGLSEAEVCSTRIMHRKDRYHSEDLIEGMIGDVRVRTSDVHIEERHEVHTKNGTEVTYVTTFLGRFLELTFNKAFNGIVVSSEDYPTHNGLEKCELELIEFNKKYKTYADTQHNAFYLLTPPMLEALLRIEKKNQGRIGIEFEGNKVYVAINNNVDTFSLSLFKPINDEALNKFKDELSCIPDLIKEIQTNKFYRGE